MMAKQKLFKIPTRLYFNYSLNHIIYMHVFINTSVYATDIPNINYRIFCFYSNILANKRMQR